MDYVPNDQAYNSGKGGGGQAWDVPGPQRHNSNAHMPPIPTGNSGAHMPPIPTGNSGAHMAPIPSGKSIFQIEAEKKQQEMAMARHGKRNINPHRFCLGCIFIKMYYNYFRKIDYG